MIRSTLARAHHARRMAREMERIARADLAGPWATWAGLYRLKRRDLLNQCLEMRAILVRAKGTVSA